MERGEKLVELMEKQNVTVRELSKRSGVPYTTIRSMLERNLNNASIDNTIKLCQALGIRVEDLLNPVPQEQDMKVEESATPYGTIKVGHTYPYIPVSISAGLPEGIEGVTEASEIKVPDSIMGRYAGHKDIRMMRVNGESMNKVIPNGSLIAVKKTEIDNIRDGDIVVYSDSHEYSVKRLYRAGDKMIFRPASTDNRFTDYVTDTRETLEIIGKVVIYIVELD